MDANPGSLVVLGAETLGKAAAVKQFKKAAMVVEKMLQKIQLCQDAQVELVLQRACLSVAKVNHLLRANGVDLLESQDDEGKNCLEEFDELQVSAIRRLVPGLTALGQEQALRAAGLGGLGLRSAFRQAAAANLASLIMARPKVAYRAEAAEAAGLFSKELAVCQHDAEIMRAFEAVKACLRPEDVESTMQLLDGAVTRAQADWQCVVAGKPTTQAQAPRMRGEVASQESGGLQDQVQRAILERGHLRSEPNELGAVVSGVQASAEHLQRELAFAVEMAAMEPFLARVEQQDGRAARRLAELLDPGTCHEWLWKINPREGSRLCEWDFEICLATRLGADVVASDQLCKLCGEDLDGTATHALCCAKAASTRGHYAVVAAVRWNGHHRPWHPARGQGVV